MSTAPPTNPRKPVDLAKLATILAVVGGIGFGLCTVGTMDDRVAAIIPIALITEVICVFSLLVIGVLAIIASIKSKD